jgi:hypothetical protein
MITCPFHLVLAQMQFELMEQLRQLSNPQLAFSPVLIISVLCHPQPPFFYIAARSSDYPRRTAHRSAGVLLYLRGAHVTRRECR